MESPKYLEQLKPQEQSKLFQQALFPSKNFASLKADPFKLLSPNRPSRLLPVCVSGALRLPKLKTNTVVTSPRILKVSKKFVLSPRNLNSSVSSNKVSKCRLSLMPATPSSKSLKSGRSQSSKILKTVEKPLFGDSLEVSFGQ
jgi:hypothetical protein